MKCVMCRQDNTLLTVGFKATCRGCGRYLHSCVQCALWDRAAERCRSLTTEPVRDRESCNFCEEYRPGKDDGHDSGGSPRVSSDFEALFGGAADD
jgi:hypothetical protein